MLRQRLQFNDRALLNPCPVVRLWRINNITIPTGDDAQHSRIRAGAYGADHLRRFESEREKAPPWRPIFRDNAKVQTGSIAFFQLDGIVVELLRGMNGRNSRQDLDFIAARKCEVEAQMSSHQPRSITPMKSFSLSCTLFTCTGIASREPSSISGMSRSKSGPECEPMSAIRTGRNK